MARDPNGDPFREIREVQDHRYDPGYWTGGRTHPLYRRSRHGNRYGWFVIGIGLFAVAHGAATLRDRNWPLVPTLLGLALGVVFVVIGARLIRPMR